MRPPINPCDHRTHDVSRTMMVRIPALSHHVLIVTQMALSWSVLATGPDHRTSCIAAIHCSVRWSVRDARVSASSVFWCSSIWKFRVQFSRMNGKQLDEDDCRIDEYQHILCQCVTTAIVELHTIRSFVSVSKTYRDDCRFMHGASFYWYCSSKRFSYIS